MSKCSGIQLLTLKQIAAWWLPKQMKDELGTVRAKLPPLQRGFVWKPDQIELLWDSIAQGFPIGSLLMSKFDPDNDNRVRATGSDGMVDNPSHFLLDGQQRATSISLGFRNIWIEECEAEETLWVDLGWEQKGSRQFMFRIVTKAHPWGFKGNDSGKLSAKQCRDALKAFNLGSTQKKKPL